MIWVLASAALARPTDGTGMWVFADTDVVTTLDSADAAVRVWYSTSGPNQVATGDDDADGVPDFVEDVAETTSAVLEFYAATGFRPPLSDGTAGGSDAMDVYLVDFGGSADGAYTAEACTRNPPVQCSGYFVMENDFRGYGYADLPTAVRVLTSHELFHAVQAAYDASEEVWWSEGTATWAEWAFDPGSEDFLAFADAYLDDTGRSIDQPPAGPVPTFAYATALWWWFLTNRYGDTFLVDLLEATEADDTLLVDMEALEEAAGGSLWEDWSAFTTWNLATGTRAGALESYPFAADIGPVGNEANGASIVDDNRYYPLAATYYRLDHPGGEVWFALEADAPELGFSLHPTDADGAVEEAVATWTGSSEPLDLGDLPAGTYWLRGANATLAEDSTKVVTCLGDADTVAACAAEASADSGDTADEGGSPETKGCGCQSGGGVGGFAAAALAAATILRRRRLPIPR
jgi:MYXO-CTERM domain-containing protein